MGKDTITGVTWREGILQWETLKRAKGELQSLGSGSLASDPDPDMEAGETGASLSDLLTRARKEGAGFSNRVSFGLNAGQVLMRVVELPVVEDKEELAGMVELQIDSLSPFPVETMSYSYEVLGASETMLTVLIAAVKREILQSIGMACEDARVRLARVDVDVLARWRDIESQYDLSGGGLCLFIICDVAACHIVMTRDGIPAAFQTLSGILSPQELSEEIQLEISYLLSSMEQSEKRANMSVELWYWDAPPQALVSCIRNNLQLSININELNSLDTEASGIAERALLQEDEGLNLFLREWHAAGLSRRARQRIIKIAVVTALMMGLALAALYGYVLWETSRLQHIKDQIAVYKPLSDETKSLKRRIQMVESYLDKDHSAIECLLVLVQAMPPSGLDLELYDYNREDDKIVVRGNGDQANLIFELEKNLQDRKFFADVKLDSVRKDPRSGRNAFRLNIWIAKGETES
jgi:hypothetical protein